LGFVMLLYFPTTFSALLLFNFSNAFTYLKTQETTRKKINPLFHLSRHTNKITGITNGKHSNAKMATTDIFLPLMNLNSIFQSSTEVAKFYEYELQNNEYALDVITSVGIHCLSNIIGQMTSFEENLKKTVNIGYMLRYGIFGMLNGSFGYFWYPTLEKFIPGTSGETVVEKVLADMCIYGTIFTALFLFLMPFLEFRLSYKGVLEGVERVRADFSTVFFGGLAFWIPANVVIYSVVAPSYRVLGSNTAVLLYTIGLAIWDLARIKRGKIL